MKLLKEIRLLIERLLFGVKKDSNPCINTPGPKSITFDSAAELGGGVSGNFEGL